MICYISERASCFLFVSFNTSLKQFKPLKVPAVVSNDVLVGVLKICLGVSSWCNG